MNVYWLEQTEADVPAGNDWLSANEAACLNSMRFAKRHADWRLGRWTAKRALSVYLDVPAQPQVFKRIDIRPAPSGAPEAFFGNQPAAVTISLSHRAGRAVCAVTMSGVEMGCDLEMVEPRSDAFVADYFTVEEQALVARASAEDRARLLALLWSGKESALKALRAGLRLDTRCVIVNPFAASFALNGWSPLQVCYCGGQVFHGWWQLADNILRTVVAAPPPDPPIPLTIPAHFFDSASRCA
jgi:4'-phosphopantetheinyl transferase